MISVDEDQKRKEKESNFLLENQDIGDGLSKLVILKRRLNIIIETNKEKRKLMDQYLRNLKIIEDAFD
jgi:HD superfamily phosphodiesterase